MTNYWLLQTPLCSCIFTILTDKGAKIGTLGVCTRLSEQLCTDLFTLESNSDHKWLRLVLHQNARADKNSNAPTSGVHRADLWAFASAVVPSSTKLKRQNVPSLKISFCLSFTNAWVLAIKTIRVCVCVCAFVCWHSPLRKARLPLDPDLVWARLRLDWTPPPHSQTPPPPGIILPMVCVSWSSLCSWV